MGTPVPAPSASPTPTPSTGGGLPQPSASGGGASPTPHPSPGGLTDPDGKDISQGDTDSDRHQRAAELAAMKPAPPGSAVAFDVQPPHVYYASYMLRNAQYDFAARARRLVGALDGHEHAVGCGTGPEAFARAYADVAGLFLDVWNKTAEGVGGAAVGLTVTANNYAQADHVTLAPTPVLVKKSPPDVLKNTGATGPVAQLGWGQAPAEDGWGNAIIDEVSGALSTIGAEILRPILGHALRHGKVADITPGGDDTALPEIAKVWRLAAQDARSSADEFNDAIAYITNPAPGHDEWQNAMKQFCSSMWGTTAWGKERHGHKWNHRDGQRPALDVLQDTARAVASGCDSVSAEVTKIRSTIVDVYKDAATRTFAMKSFKDALELIGKLPELAAEFIANIDTGRLNHAVDSYNSEIHKLADGLTDLKEALEEAGRSVPTYAAEEARAEAFGARSLDEFRHELRWSDPEDTKNGIYRIDLASSEWLGDGHTLDKHVGKSSEQLAQRLRDQGDAPTANWPHGKPTVGAASSFADLASAQRFTQYNIDAHSAEVKAWLQGPPPPADGDVKKLVGPGPNGEVTGMGVMKQPYDPSDPLSGFKQGGMNVRSTDLKNLDTRLKYDSTLDPPFVVITSMPAR